MKHIRIIALSLSLVLMLGLFAACGKGGSESSSDSQSSAGTSQSDADASSSATVTPDASQPEAETPAPDASQPEEKPQAPAPESKPEQKPTPETKPEQKPEAPAPQPEQKPAAVDLAAFYATIFTDPENSPALVPMENDALDGFFPGLNALPLTQKVAYMPMMTAVPCEIVMVECANAADAETVKGIFKARIDSQINNQSNYPMVIEAWEKEAKIVSNGNFVALFVISGMTEQVASSFNALF